MVADGLRVTVEVAWAQAAIMNAAASGAIADGEGLGIQDRPIRRTRGIVFRVRRRARESVRSQSLAEPANRRVGPTGCSRLCYVVAVYNFAICVRDGQGEIVIQAAVLSWPRLLLMGYSFRRARFSGL